MNPEKENQLDQSVKKHFSQYSKDYYNHVQGHLCEMYQNIASVLNACLCGNLLDVGNGGVLIYDTNRLDKIIAVDVAYPKEMQDTEKITFLTRDARNLHFFEDNTFDCILLQFLLHHVVEKTRKQTDESLAKLLEEMFRVLRPGGKLIIVESIVYPIFELFENLFYRINSYILKCLNRPMIKFYSKQGLRRHLKKAGYCMPEFEHISLGKRWIPLAPALFPGKFVISPKLYPTRVFCIKAQKRMNLEI